MPSLHSRHWMAWMSPTGIPHGSPCEKGEHMWTPPQVCAIVYRHPFSTQIMIRTSWLTAQPLHHCSMLGSILHRLLISYHIWECLLYFAATTLLKAFCPALVTWAIAPSCARCVVTPLWNTPLWNTLPEPIRKALMHVSFWKMCKTEWFRGTFLYRQQSWGVIDELVRWLFLGIRFFLHWWSCCLKQICMHALFFSSPPTPPHATIPAQLH